MRSAVVLLPLPDGPTSGTREPAGIANDSRLAAAGVGQADIVQFDLLAKGQLRTGGRHLRDFELKPLDEVFDYRLAVGYAAI